MSLWRIGWTGLLGVLAGMVLFPRPAQGPGVAADPPAKGAGEGPLRDAPPSA